MKARKIGEITKAARWRAWSAVEPPKAAEGRDSAPTAAEGDENVRACSSPHNFLIFFFISREGDFHSLSNYLASGWNST